MGPPGKIRWSYYPLVNLPAALDIVWCRFPEHLTPGKPGPKARPGLVRGARLSPDHQRAQIEVTYGTSRLKLDDRPLDLIIQNASELAAMGLPQVTRFDLDQTVWLPWCAEFFEPRSGQNTPIIGHLTPATVAQLETLKVLRRRR